MQQCQKCQGLVPDGSSSCPNCTSSKQWWKAPLAILGAGFATVTLSACYGAPCATTITLPDGGTLTEGEGASRTCQPIDCRVQPDAGADGEPDYRWKYACEEHLPSRDAGVADGGVDGGP